MAQQPKNDTLTWVFHWADTRGDTNTANSLSFIKGSPSSASALARLVIIIPGAGSAGGDVLTEHIAKELGSVFVQHSVSNAWLSIKVNEIIVTSKKFLHELDPWLFCARLVRQG